MRVRARVEVTRASAELATMREQLKAVTVERDHYAERIATLVDADRALEKVRAEVERLRVRMRDAEVAARGAQVTIEAWVPEGQSVDNNDNYCYLMDWLKGCPPDGQQELTRAAEARGLEVAREAIEAVLNLIDNSSGVVGLHLNGDEAPWEELLAGGRFEPWLLALSTAAAKLVVSTKDVPHEA